MLRYTSFHEAEKTSRAAPRKARSAGELQRLSFQAIRVPTRAGSCHLSSDGPPAASSVSTLTAGKTETPIPALTHRFMASMLWNSSVSLDTTSTSESCRSNQQAVNVSDKVVRPRVLPLAGLGWERFLVSRKNRGMRKVNPSACLGE
jgi:hypothetical protein